MCRPVKAVWVAACCSGQHLTRSDRMGEPRGQGSSVSAFLSSVKSPKELLGKKL